MELHSLYSSPGIQPRIDIMTLREDNSKKADTFMSIAECSKDVFDDIDSRPTLAMPKHYEKENIRVLKACEDLGIVFQTFDYYNPQIDPDALNQELNKILSIDDYSKPIPQNIVAAATEGNEEKYPFLRKLKVIADNIVSQNSAVILPGGISVHPKFYGEEDIHGETKGFYDFDPRRTILEFFLINGCKTTGTPLLGICRGHQIINIYHGGTLDRNSLDEIQLSKIRESVATLPSTPFKVPTTVFFNHRQSVTKLGEGLRNFMRVNALTDVDGERAKIVQYFVEAEGTVAAGREMYVDIGAEEIYDRAVRDLAERDLTSRNIEKLLGFLEKENIVIAAENQFGAPMIGVQFHPEDIDEISDSVRVGDIKGNSEIFRIFTLMAKTAYHKQAVLKEILNPTAYQRLSDKTSMNCVPALE